MLATMSKSSFKIKLTSDWYKSRSQHKVCLNKECVKMTNTCNELCLSERNATSNFVTKGQTEGQSDSQGLNSKLYALGGGVHYKLNFT